MYVFHPSDFATWRDLADYVANLRVPIPVVVSAAEIIEYQLTGDLLLTTRVAYQAALFISYGLALRMAWGSPGRRVASLALSIIYVVGTRWIHYANPQTYDVFFPCLLLGYVTLLDLSAGARTMRSRAALAVGAGVALALVDLTRPFAVFLLPPLVWGAWRTLRAVDGRLIWAFLAPLVALSGAWHLQTARLEGQVTWGNHSGFNLQRGWPVAPAVELLPDPGGKPLKAGRWANLNTPTHGENSRLLQSAMVAFVREQPGFALGYALKKLQYFMATQTGFYNWHPQSPWLTLYRPAVWAGLVWLGLQVAVLAAALIRRQWPILARPQSQLALATAATVVILAVAEGGEEARLMITVLPLLAALPRVKVTGSGRPDGSAGEKQGARH
jgi:hypothetical protein